MEVVAKHRNLRMSPRKVRLILPQFRNRNALEAVAELELTAGKAALPVAKAIKSAVANAEHNYSLDPNSLVVRKLTADEGPAFKRYVPASRGRAMGIKRQTSHLTVVLADVPMPKGSGAVKRAVKKVVPKKAAKPAAKDAAAPKAGSKVKSVQDAKDRPQTKTRAQVKQTQPRKTDRQTGRSAAHVKKGSK